MECRNCMLRTIRFLVAFSLAWLTTPAHALSCVGVSDRFYLQCSQQRCQISFRARDVPALGGCGRRTVVEDSSADVAAVLLSHVSAQMFSGAYEITLIHRYYSDPPVSSEELARAFGAHELRAPQVSVQRLAPQANLTNLRNEWESRSRNSMLALVGYWTLELLLISGSS